MDRPAPADDHPEVVHLARPDGRWQVGLGARAWLVQGWAPGSRSAAGPAASLVQGLVGRPTDQRALPYQVQGQGELATELREELGHSLGKESPDGLVVLVSHYAVPVGTARRPDLVSRPVLPVTAQSDRVVLGPWTGLPGAPCLHCLDLHRTDRDPDWPFLAAALDDPLTSPVPPRQEQGVLGIVRALTTLLVSGARGDGRDEHGLAYEVGAGRPHLVTRRWTRHPACPWHGDRPGAG